MEIPGGGGCHRRRNFRKVGGGEDVVLMNFFTGRSQFSYCCTQCFVVCIELLESRTQKK